MGRTISAIKSAPGSGGPSAQPVQRRGRRLRPRPRRHRRDSAAGRASACCSTGAKLSRAAVASTTSPGVRGRSFGAPAPSSADASGAYEGDIADVQTAHGAGLRPGSRRRGGRCYGGPDGAAMAGAASGSSSPAGTGASSAPSSRALAPAARPAAGWSLPAPASPLPAPWPLSQDHSGPGATGLPPPCDGGTRGVGGDGHVGVGGRRPRPFGGR